jgi:hypothetical protein
MRNNALNGLSRTKEGKQINEFEQGFGKVIYAAIGNCNV